MNKVIENEISIVVEDNGWSAYYTVCPKCGHVNRSRHYLPPVSFLESCRGLSCSEEYIVRPKSYMTTGTESIPEQSDSSPCQQSPSQCSACG